MRLSYKCMAYQEDSYYIERVLQHKDAAAFEGLVNKHKTLAFNIALRITKNREDAEEVAQDAFIKLYHALSEFKGDAKFTTWFFRIVYNLALSKIRKKKKRNTWRKQSAPLMRVTSC